MGPQPGAYIQASTSEFGLLDDLETIEQALRLRDEMFLSSVIARAHAIIGGRACWTILNRWPS